MIIYHKNGQAKDPIKGFIWDLSSAAAKIPRTEDTITYGLTLTDNTGRDIEVVNSIPVKQTTLSKKRQERIRDKIIERYTLVLFDFAASKIDPANQHVIDLINEQITPGTKATVTGYADRTGSEEYDMKLTEDRANAVAKMLKATDINAKGLGKSKLLFDNNIPEGRLYSRTVNVVLEKPI
jgi:outer membrane protein OmpA-like peptidoglycan-associated protein